MNTVDKGRCSGYVDCKTRTTKHRYTYSRNRSFAYVDVMIIKFVVFLTIAYVCADSDGSKSNAVFKTKSDKSVLSTLELTQNCDKCETELDSIKALHRLLDDDHNGSVDQVESDEFIRDELKYTDGFERQSKFHGGDKLISVDDLWRVWTDSPVHNWTVDDVLEWLVMHVELGQYTETFKTKGVNGSFLPRVAVNSNHFLSEHLGIKNSIHKQKLSLKAVDIVLFGPPKKAHSYVKDLALIFSLVVAVGGCWFAYSQYNYSQSHMKKMIRDLDSLQRAEDTLIELQNKLDLAEQSQRSVTMEKDNLKQKFCDEITTAKNEASRLKTAREGTMEEISRMKLAEEELKQVRSALLQAETQLDSRPTLFEIQPWLQLCHEMELKHYQAKRSAAEKQLATVREECSKMRKKRTSLVGTLRSTSIDDIDKKIASARSAFDEVRHDLQERQHRWATIEYTCRFPIVQNHGLAYLCSLLQRDINSYGTVIVTTGITAVGGAHVKSMSSLDSIDDEYTSLPPLKQLGQQHGSADSSNGYNQTWPMKRSVSQHTNVSSNSDTSVSPPVKFDIGDTSMVSDPINEDTADGNVFHSPTSLPTTNGDNHQLDTISENSLPLHTFIPRRSSTAADLNSSHSGSMEEVGNVVRSNTFSGCVEPRETERRKVKKKKLVLPSFLKKDKVH